MEIPLHEVIETHTSQVLNKLLSLTSRTITAKDVHVKSEDIEYIKRVEVHYIPYQFSLFYAFTKKSLEVLKKYSEEHIKSFYDNIDKEILFTNFIGIIIHSMYTTITQVPLPSKIDFSLSKPTSIVRLLNNHYVWEFYDADKVPVVYLGVSLDTYATITRSSSG